MGLTRPTVAQLNTVVTEISDPISVLNKGSTQANVDIGLVFNRDGGVSPNVALYWNETIDSLVAALTTSTGGENSNIAVSSYANLQVNSLTGTIVTASQPNITSIGNLSSLALSGNISTTGYYFGNGSQLTGIITSVTKIINGTTNVTAYDSNDIAVTVGGVANTVIFSSSTPSTSTTTGAIKVSGGVGVTGNVNAAYFAGNGSQLTAINAFGNVFISGQSPVLADNTSDTLTLISGSGIAITTDAANDAVTISTVSTVGPFATSGDFALITDVVSVSEDEGLVTDAATVTYDLGSIISSTGLIYPDQLVLPSYTTAALPSATVAAQLAYNTTKQTPTFTDGSNWYEVGYKDMPQVAAGNVTLGITDSGKHYYSTSGAPLTLTVPSYSNVALPVGAAIMVVNRGVGSITVTPQVEVSMYLAGNTTSASRTIASYCLASLIKTESNVWIISGVGVY